MLKIKKYANGRFFDTAAKKYIKPEKLAEMIKKGEQIQVILTKTGKDITDKVISQFAKKEDPKKNNPANDTPKIDLPFLKTDKLVKWLGDVIDSKIEKVMDIVKLPSREQVAQLDENIKALNKKIDALKLSREKAAPRKKAAPKRKAAPKKPAGKAKKTTAARPEETGTSTGKKAEPGKA